MKNIKVAHLNFSDSGSGASIAAFRMHELTRNTEIKSIMLVDKKLTNEDDIKLFNNFISRLNRLFFDKLFKVIFFILNGYKEQISLNLISSKKTKSINSHYGVNIIHLHWINREMISINDIAEMKLPVIWTLHDMWALGGIKHYFNKCSFNYDKSNKLQKKISLIIEKYIYKKKLKLWTKPIQLTVPSKWLFNEVKKNQITKNWPVEIIPNPLDFNIWKPIDKCKARKNYGFELNDIVICFGGLDADQDSRKGYKEFINLIANFDLTKKENKKISLLIFGFEDQELYKRFRDKFRIYFVGYTNKKKELINAYSASDIYIQPSKMETFGQTALESIACKTPVVAFDNTGVSDIVVHKKTGYLAEHNNYDDLLRGMQWVLENVDRIGDKYILDLENNFSYENVSKKLTKLYLKTLI